MSRETDIVRTSPIKSKGELCMSVSRRFIVWSTLAVGLSLLAVGCGGKGKVKGEITGVAGKQMVQKAGVTDLGSLEFAGQLQVKLPDGETVMAECPEEILSELRGAPEFKGMRTAGGSGFVMTVVVPLDQGQEVVLVRDESDAWVVKDII
jgi:hypothetical protein